MSAVSSEESRSDEKCGAGRFSGNLAIRRLQLTTLNAKPALGYPSAKLTPSIEAQFTQSNSNDDILNLVEAAAYLRCCTKTLGKEATAGNVPGKKLGATWRFYRPALDEWLRQAA